jgi:L-malate glycosyltransferase
VSFAPRICGFELGELDSARTAVLSVMSKRTILEGQADVAGTAASSTGQHTNRPRVVHFVGTFAQGGSERQAIQLAGLMKRCGRYDVRLATLDPYGLLREEAEQLGFQDIAAYPLTSFYNWNMAVQLSRCASQLRSSKVSVIHTHDFYSNIFAITAGALAGVPVRIASRRETGGIRTPAQQWAERRAYGLAHAVVANSQAVRLQLLREGVTERKTKVIYNGLELERFRRPGPGATKGTEFLPAEENPRRPISREEMLAMLGLPTQEGYKIVTIVANLRHPVKDHVTFLRAASLVRREIPEACFVLAGEGKLLEPMRRLALELDLHDRAFFLGRCQRIPQLLQVSEVCVLSSRFEGFSNAILEYMAAGRPVVATDVGGAREAVTEGETGYLVAAGDQGAMAARIVRLLRNHEEATSFGERGRRVVEERFSSMAQLRNTEELYRRLLEDRKYGAAELVG